MIAASICGRAQKEWYEAKKRAHTQGEDDEKREKKDAHKEKIFVDGETKSQWVGLLYVAHLLS